MIKIASSCENLCRRTTLPLTTWRQQAFQGIRRYGTAGTNQTNAETPADITKGKVNNSNCPMHPIPQNFSTSRLPRLVKKFAELTNCLKRKEVPKMKSYGLKYGNSTKEACDPSYAILRRIHTLSIVKKGAGVRRKVNTRTIIIKGPNIEDMTIGELLNTRNHIDSLKHEPYFLSNHSKLPTFAIHKLESNVMSTYSSLDCLSVISDKSSGQVQLMMNRSASEPVLNEKIPKRLGNFNSIAYVAAPKEAVNDVEDQSCNYEQHYSKNTLEALDQGAALVKVTKSDRMLAPLNRKKVVANEDIVTNEAICDSSLELSHDGCDKIGPNKPICEKSINRDQLPMDISNNPSDISGIISSIDKSSTYIHQDFYVTNKMLDKMNKERKNIDEKPKDSSKGKFETADSNFNKDLKRDSDVESKNEIEPPTHEWGLNTVDTMLSKGDLKKFFEFYKIDEPCFTHKSDDGSLIYSYRYGIQSEDGKEMHYPEDAEGTQVEEAGEEIDMKSETKCKFDCSQGYPSMLIDGVAYNLKNFPPSLYSKSSSSSDRGSHTKGGSDTIDFNSTVDVTTETCITSSKCGNQVKVKVEEKQTFKDKRLPITFTTDSSMQIQGSCEKLRAANETIEVAKAKLVLGSSKADATIKESMDHSVKLAELLSFLKHKVLLETGKASKKIPIQFGESLNKTKSKTSGKKPEVKLVDKPRLIKTPKTSHTPKSKKHQSPLEKSIKNIGKDISKPDDKLNNEKIGFMKKNDHSHKDKTDDCKFVKLGSEELGRLLGFSRSFKVDACSRKDNKDDELVPSKSIAKGSKPKTPNVHELHRSQKEKASLTPGKEKPSSAKKFIEIKPFVKNASDYKKKEQLPKKTFNHAKNQLYKDEKVPTKNLTERDLTILKGLKEAAKKSTKLYSDGSGVVTKKKSDIEKTVKKPEKDDTIKYDFSKLGEKSRSTTYEVIRFDANSDSKDNTSSEKSLESERNKRLPLKKLNEYEAVLSRQMKKTNDSHSKTASKHESVHGGVIIKEKHTSPAVHGRKSNIGPKVKINIDKLDKKPPADVNVPSSQGKPLVKAQEATKPKPQTNAALIQDPSVQNAYRWLVEEVPSGGESTELQTIISKPEDDHLLTGTLLSSKKDESDKIGGKKSATSESSRISGRQLDKPSKAESAGKTEKVEQKAIQKETAKVEEKKTLTPSVPKRAWGYTLEMPSKTESETKTVKVEQKIVQKVSGKAEDRKSHKFHESSKVSGQAFEIAPKSMPKIKAENVQKESLKTEEKKSRSPVESAKVSGQAFEIAPKIKSEIKVENVQKESVKTEEKKSRSPVESAKVSGQAFEIAPKIKPEIKVENVQKESLKTEEKKSRSPVESAKVSGQVFEIAHKIKPEIKVENVQKESLKTEEKKYRSPVESAKVSGQVFEIAPKIKPEIKVENVQKESLKTEEKKSRSPVESAKVSGQVFEIAPKIKPEIKVENVQKESLKTEEKKYRSPVESAKVSGQAFEVPAKSEPSIKTESVDHKTVQKETTKPEQTKRFTPLESSKINEIITEKKTPVSSAMYPSSESSSIPLVDSKTLPESKTVVVDQKTIAMPEYFMLDLDKLTREIKPPLDVRSPKRNIVSLDQLMDFPLLNEFKHSYERPDDGIICLDCKKDLVLKQRLRTVPSVTTILNATMSDSSKIALTKWRKNMVSKLGEAGFQEFYKGQINKGSDFHEKVQRHFSGHIQDLAVSSNPALRSISALSQFISDVTVVESHVVHERLMYRGVIDCVARYKNRPVVIEWKRSDKKRLFLESTFDAPLQLCAYIGALNYDDNYPLQVDGGIVVIAYGDGSPADVFTVPLDDCEKYWKYWLARLKKYRTDGGDVTLP